MTLPMSEADFSLLIEELLERFGWRYVHNRPARVMIKGKETYRTALTGQPGYPDYTCLRLGRDGDRTKARHLVIELKSDTGKLSIDQIIWLELFRAVPGTEVYVFKPSDNFYEIAEILRRD